MDKVSSISGTKHLMRAQFRGRNQRNRRCAKPLAETARACRADSPRSGRLSSAALPPHRARDRVRRNDPARARKTPQRRHKHCDQWIVRRVRHGVPETGRGAIIGGIVADGSAKKSSPYPVDDVTHALYTWSCSRGRKHWISAVFEGWLPFPLGSTISHFHILENLRRCLFRPLFQGLERCPASLFSSWKRF